MLKTSSLMGGKYKPLRRIGRGGQAEVWKAEQTGIAGFSREVVLKIVPTTHEEELKRTEQLLEEARLAARIQHPNVISVFEAGRENNLAFVAMEYIEGHDLQQLLHRQQESTGKPLPWPIVAHIGIKLCQGLHYAHQLRDRDGQPLHIVHRDLKPENVLISNEGFVKLIDFGIAKTSDAKRLETEPERIKGTPHYMSPEQLMDEGTDARSDLFSLGVVLFELLTGRRPFYGDNMFTIMLSVVNKEPLPFETPDVPQALKDLVHCLLQKSKEERISSAHETYRQLQRILNKNDELVEQDELREFYHQLFSKERAVAVAFGSGIFDVCSDSEERNKPDAITLCLKPISSTDICIADNGDSFIWREDLFPAWEDELSPHDSCEALASDYEEKEPEETRKISTFSAVLLWLIVGLLIAIGVTFASLL